MPGVRRSAVLGLPVVTREGARRLGVVEDLLLDRRGRRVVGLLLAGASIVRGARVVPYEVVCALGPSAIILREGVTLTVPAAKGALLRDMARRHRDLLGTRVLDESGVDRGTIDDVAFDPPSGRVLGFSVSSGVLRDLLEGQAFLPADDRLEWSGDGVALVRSRRPDNPPPGPGGERAG